MPNNGVYDYEGARTEIAKALTDVYGGKWTVYAAPDCPAELGTGLYADPDMYDAKNKLDLLQAGDAVRNAFSMMMKPDPMPVR